MATDATSRRGTCGGLGVGAQGPPRIFCDHCERQLGIAPPGVDWTHSGRIATISLGPITDSPNRRLRAALVRAWCGWDGMAGDACRGRTMTAARRGRTGGSGGDFGRFRGRWIRAGRSRAWAPGGRGLCRGLDSAGAELELGLRRWPRRRDGWRLRRQADALQIAAYRGGLRQGGDHGDRSGARSLGVCLRQTPAVSLGQAGYSVTSMEKTLARRVAHAILCGM